MSIETIRLRQEIKELKDTLYQEGSLNQQGYFQIDEQYFSNYFVDCLRRVRKLAENNPQELLEDSKLTQELFKFDKIQTSFLYKEVARKINASEANSWNNLKIARPLFPIIFINCRLDECILKGSVNVNLFASVEIASDCIIGRASLSSTFFGKKNVYQFSATDCTIENIAFFSSPSNHFDVPVNFVNCEFKYNFNAAGAHFNAPLTFNSCGFNEREQENPSARVIFNNAEFSTSTEFSECDFYTSPKFHEAKMHSDTSFHLTNFHDVSSDAAEGDYRALKQLMHGTGAENEALKFHALEMESRKNTVLPKIAQVFHREFPASLSSHFLKLFNDYGRNYFLPWFWLAWFTGVFFCLYSVLGVFGIGVGCNNVLINDAEIWLQDYCSNDLLNSNGVLLRNFVYASHRAFGPLGLVLDSGLLSALSGWVKLLSFIQVIFSSVIWYLIIIQLRRQFKL